MNFEEVLTTLSDDPSATLDVAEVAFLFARDEYPDLDVEAYVSEIDGMAHEAKTYMRGDLNAQLTGLCRYLFHEMGFRGNVKNYYDPRNSYLNIVLERRTGIPITLSAVAMAVGRRAGLEIHGIGLPGHFVAKAVDGSQELLFDPFHGGRRIYEEDCENLVRQVANVPFQATAETLQAIPLGRMVQRMLNNLKAIYLGQSDFRRGVRTIERLKLLEPNNAYHDRDLGACYLQLQQPGKAVDRFRIYLKAIPNPADAEQVEKLIMHAQRELAKWN